MVSGWHDVVVSGDRPGGDLLLTSRDQRLACCEQLTRNERIVRLPRLPVDTLKSAVGPRRNVHGHYDIGRNSLGNPLTDDRPDPASRLVWVAPRADELLKSAS